MNFKTQESEEIKDEGLHIDTNLDELVPMIRPGLVGHTWRQRGPYIHCISCGLGHSTYVGVNKQLIGINDDGTPRFRTVK